MLQDSAALLVALLDRLLGQHKAGLNPTPGQIEDLSDLKNRVKADLDTPPGGRRSGPLPCEPDVPERFAARHVDIAGPSQFAMKCQVITCPKNSSRNVEGHVYCQKHANLVARVVADVRRRMHEIALEAAHTQVQTGGVE